MFTHRLATEADLPALHALMTAAIEQLQHGFLSPEQVAASHKVMGLDTQLVADRTYFMVEEDGRLAGCGGWSPRATLYGGDASIVAREARTLDPAVDAAKVRAMYTSPDFARRGVGRLILSFCEGAARDAGFKQVELMGTMSGEPLYRACGYREVERIADDVNGVSVPLVRMRKDLA